jgi:putative zinc finger protein
MIDQDHRELARLRAAFAVTDDVPTPECLAAETLLAAVRGELPPRELRQALDHLASCASCSEDWRLAAEIERQSSKSVTSAAPSSGRVIQGRFGSWRPLAAAAVLAAGLLIAVGVYRTGGLIPQPPTDRGPRDAAVHSLLAEGQALPRQGAVLRWSAVPRAASYDVRISTDDLRPVQTAESLTATEYRIPDASLAALPAGAKLLWQVEAVFPDGTRRTSPTFTNPLR